MTRFRIAAWCLWIASVAGAAQAARADGPLAGLLKSGAPTAGSGFVWSTEVAFHDYRIEKHALIGHYRLIQLTTGRPRITFGSFDACLAKLAEIKREQNLGPMPEHVVIVLHGLGAGPGYMQGLADYLEEQGGYPVVNFGYPSTMGKIEEFAASLDSVVRHLEGTKRISFVAHSMGNIVVRRYLYDMSRLTPAMRPEVSYERMVMISPPNHGAEIADRIGDMKIVQMAAGEPVDELAPTKGWPELEKRLATPDFEFGVIVGGRGDDQGYLPGVPGDDDGLLTIETSKLAGASDFIQVGGIHQLMARYKEVRTATLSFLTNGYFTTIDARQPLAAQ
ncbi:MAG: hypothetical protein KF847_16940 [Pirellulales bacterium]|nr:hypothetical protein [Pirellulales bacterium]